MTALQRPAMTPNDKSSVPHVSIKQEVRPAHYSNTAKPLKQCIRLHAVPLFAFGGRPVFRLYHEHNERHKMEQECILGNTQQLG